MPMRRADRQVEDPKKICEILQACQICRLGLQDQDGVYVVPLSYGFSWQGGVCTLFFHGAQAGKKLALIEKNPHAGFEMDTAYALQEAESACSHSARFQSVMGQGVVRMLQTQKEKRQALQAIMAHYRPEKEWEFSEKMLDSVAAFCLQVREISCKVHL